MKRPRTINKPRRVIHDPEELPFICDAIEIGLLLRMNPEQVNKLARDGTLPGTKLGNAWRFRKTDVLSYLDNLICGVM